MVSEMVNVGLQGRRLENETFIIVSFAYLHFLELCSWTGNISLIM